MCKNVALEAGPLAGLQKLVNIDFSSAAPPQTDIAKTGSCMVI